jgi:hypothetical protein
MSPSFSLFLHAQGFNLSLIACGTARTDTDLAGARDAFRNVLTPTGATTLVSNYSGGQGARWSTLKEGGMIQAARATESVNTSEHDHTVFFFFFESHMNQPVPH